MLEIKFTVSDVDYDSVLSLLLPKLAESESKLGRLAKRHGGLIEKIAHRVLNRKGEQGTEELVVSLLEQKQDVLMEKASEFIKEKGLKMEISNFSVTRKEMGKNR